MSAEQKIDNVDCRRSQILEDGLRTLTLEAQAIEDMKNRMNGDFTDAVELILSCTGRVVLTGMGKSGLVCQKIAATMASTGTVALFLHPAEGVHGDLGMLAKGDVVIAASNSGETDEISKILPVIKRMGLPLISMTSKKTSTLGRAADVFLDISVKEEACPLKLAPTCSTTVTMAMGDALSMALLVQRGFKREDFALFHPAGSLGKQLLLRVRDIMHTGSNIPLVNEKTLVKDALYIISSKGFGVTGVTNAVGDLVGVFTDGDLRDTIEGDISALSKEICAVMTKNPKRILVDNLAAKAVQRMEEHSISSLFVFDDDEAKQPVGILHLQDLLREGVI